MCSGGLALLGPGSPQLFVVARHSPVFPYLSRDCHPAAVTGRDLLVHHAKGIHVWSIGLVCVVHNHIDVFICYKTTQLTVSFKLWEPEEWQVKDV